MCKVRMVGSLAGRTFQLSNKRWIESRPICFLDFLLLIVRFPPSQAHSMNMSIWAGRRCGVALRRVPGKLWDKVRGRGGGGVRGSWYIHTTPKKLHSCFIFHRNSTARKKGPGGPFLIKQILRFSDVFRRFPVALAEGPDCDVNPAVVRKWFERLQRSSNVMNKRKFSLISNTIWGTILDKT